MSRVSSKHQITIPVEVMRKAGIRAGDELTVRVSGPGRVEFERVEDLVSRWAGSIPPRTYHEGYLERLRTEWER